MLGARPSWRRAGRIFCPAGFPSSTAVASATTTQETPPPLRGGRGQDAHAPRKTVAAGGMVFRIGGSARPSALEGARLRVPTSFRPCRDRRFAWAKGVLPLLGARPSWRRAGRIFCPAGFPSSTAVASATTTQETPPPLRGGRGQDAHAPRKTVAAGGMVFRIGGSVRPSATKVRRRCG